MPNDIPLLIRCGKWMYGSRWQTDLSEALGVNARTVRRWVAGDTPVPYGVYADIRKLVTEKVDRAGDMVPDLDKAMEEILWDDWKKQTLTIYSKN